MRARAVRGRPACALEESEIAARQLLNTEQLRSHAAQTARCHDTVLRAGPDRILPRLADNERVLQRAYRSASQVMSRERQLTPAEEWLLDNFYLIQQQIHTARLHLPRAYSRKLPRLQGGARAGTPRVYDMALDLITHVDSRVDHENARNYLEGYQTGSALMIGELWAFPTMLRLALIENLRVTASQVTESRRLRDLAISWSERILQTAARKPNDVILQVAEMARARLPLVAPFANELYRRVQVGDPALRFLLRWIEDQIAEQGLSIEQFIQSDTQAQASAQVSVANSIGSMRFVGSADWRQFVESMSVTERVLRQDPAQVYAKQDFATRDMYRHVTEDLAAESGVAEDEVAQAAIRLATAAGARDGFSEYAAHVGFYLVDDGRKDLERAVLGSHPVRQALRNALRRLRLPLYLGAITIFTAALSFGVIAGLKPFDLSTWRMWLLGVLTILGSSTVAVALANLLVTRLTCPRVLPRLDFSAGVPRAHRTLVAVPCLLTDPEEVRELLASLELRYLSNRDANIFFALLTDFKDAPQQTMPQDEALLAQARDGVIALNDRYRSEDGRDSIFYLFHRARTWNRHERVWMGFERKRGKLEQLNAVLRRKTENGFAEITGDLDVLTPVNYVLTLDADTRVPHETAAKLIGTLAHPLNHPAFDERRGRVVRGYALLQPRIAVSVTAASRTRFARLMAGDAGLDPYTRAVSDVYQDLFAEGSYVGKGLYHVETFQRATQGRFPENVILSHDLLEGSYVRTALVSDIELFEELPLSYSAAAARRHRWIRGDWQISGWLWPRPPAPDGTRLRNPLGWLARWKTIDNLRRSLVPPAILGLLVAGWLFAPQAAWVLLIFVAVIIILPPLMTAIGQSLRKPGGREWQIHLEAALKDAKRGFLQAILDLALLPYNAWSDLDAFARSGLRMPFLRLTRRGLLRWHSPAYARRNSRSDLSDFIAETWMAPFVTLACVVWLAVIHPGAIWPALPLLCFWFAAPLIAWWVSQPLVGTESPLSEHRRQFLNVVARRTWRYFEEFVGAQDNWLPPDNYQEQPDSVLASRTSPTNIGMALLADLAAWDLGFISLNRLCARTAASLAVLEKLERFRGHFYNWYNTRSLTPLRPMYVSTVDSGNLAGSLLTLQAGLQSILAEPPVGRRLNAGLRATLDVLSAVLNNPSSEESRQLSAVRDSLRETPATHETALAMLANVLRDSEPLAAEAGRRKDAEAVWWAQALVELAREQEDNLRNFAPGAELGTQRDRRIDDLAQRCGALADMDFSFLYDRERDLFAIGFNVSERRRDPSDYDLLASEARLASYLLIAKGLIPQRHWFSLGRLMTRAAGKRALLSWSGSMFEYLMPIIWMPYYPGTLLAQTYQAVVARQIEYGQQRGVPWGISESCYHATNAEHVYQYSAFGVPDLGFRRNGMADLVVAPYASALALMVAPHEACANLERMSAQGFLARYGFYEAIDYTASRAPRGSRFGVVRSFMTHHQGMVMLAIANTLCDSVMQERFMAAPHMRATDLLLQERIPPALPTVPPHAAEEDATPRPVPVTTGPRISRAPHSAVPELKLLSNGRYHVAITAAGSGYSRWRDIALTRWREDLTRDPWGTFIYLRDRDSGKVWSVGHQPLQSRPDEYEVTFLRARIEFRRRDSDIETHMRIAVSPEDDLEIRHLKLVNLSDRPRHIEVTTYAEVVLAPSNTDLAQRAFASLFVQTEIVRDREAIICTRRRREPGETAPWMLHLLALESGTASGPSYETNRRLFIGRCRGPMSPIALYNPTDSPGVDRRLQDSQGTVLDPIVAIRRTFEIQPDETVSFYVMTGAADSRDAALAIVDRYRDPHFADRAIEMSWAHNQVMLSNLGLGEDEAQAYEHLAASLLFANPIHRAPPSVIARNPSGQSGLWRFGISGDLPIVLLRVGDFTRRGVVRDLLRAHAYWRYKGLTVDLVIVNEDYSGYRQQLHDEILGLVRAAPGSPQSDAPGGVFVRSDEQMSEEDRILFQAVARIVVTESTDSLMQQAQRRAAAERLPQVLRVSRREETHVPAPLTPTPRLFENGLGGFTADGHEYIIALEPGKTTPAPWANVIAAQQCGTVVSESGGAYTWVENAHEFRLTTWNNDPVSDTSGEAMYIRDEETGRFWSPSSLPAAGAGGYLCRHGFGYSVFEHDEAGLHSEMWVYVAMDAPVKLTVLRLRNASGRRRRLSLTGYWELVLGEWRESNLMHAVIEIDSQTGALLARNPFARDFPNRIFFANVSEALRSSTGSRTEFIGRGGSLASPQAMRHTHLSGRVGASLDPCAALQTVIDMNDGEEREVVFAIGAANPEEAPSLATRFANPETARQALEAVWAFWNETLGAVHVETGEPAVDFLTNGWLLYQTLSARFWGRSGYYQSSGAYGFRDQLQDSVALLHVAPWITRGHLLQCAGRQFRQGDVQHWWHPPSGRGVRTRISDDYLWLPYVTCRYVETTGDTGVLDETAPFLEGRALDPNEEAVYDLWPRATEEGSLYEHCRRAIRHGLRFGPHDLPLIGTGDWNDGMNRVGRAGRGESVWLGWFLCDVMRRFANVARAHNDAEFATFCTEQAADLARRIEIQGWDGAWYRRAYFDDGTPLGSVQNPECRIDSLSQSWAVLSKAGDRERARLAMQAVDEHLVRRDTRLVLLLEPPFDSSALEPGYIKGYVPGVRENGGQYTHAAIWAGMAFAQLGQCQRAWEICDILNPILRSATPSDMELFRVEPYVMAADVYSAPPHVGVGGWTWYTGSSGWMYQFILGTLIGLRREVDRLYIAPCPREIPQPFNIDYRFRGSEYHIAVSFAEPGGAPGTRVKIDGIQQDTDYVPLVDDHAEHAVEVTVPLRSGQ